MQKRYYIILFLILLAGAAVGQTQECDCEEGATVEEFQQKADLIFEGKLIHATTNWMSGGMKYTFLVNQYWKKRVDSLVFVNADFEESACGLPFEKDQIYLVYATKGFSVKTNRCSGTKKLAEAETDLAFLGPGQEPTVSPMVSMMNWSLILLTALAFLLVAFVVLRKRLRPQSN
jgi:hypothetical protein